MPLMVINSSALDAQLGGALGSAAHDFVTLRFEGPYSDGYPLPASAVGMTRVLALVPSSDSVEHSTYLPVFDPVDNVVRLFTKAAKRWVEVETGTHVSVGIDCSVLGVLA